jgi:hypothetical protein
MQKYTGLDHCELFHPVILAEGKPLFRDIKQRHTLKLPDAKTFENGVVLLRYSNENTIRRMIMRKV